MTADVPDPDDVDPEDLAEAFDETHYSEDGDEVVDPDLFDQAYDDTQKLGDADDGDEFDPDDLDGEEDGDDELEDVTDAFEPDDNDIPGEDDPDEGFNEDALDQNDIEGLDVVADADQVDGGEDDFTNFQSRRVSDEDLAAMGYDDAIAGKDKPDPHVEDALDEALEETFPASDPVSIAPSSD